MHCQLTTFCSRLYLRSDPPKKKKIAPGMLKKRKAADLKKPKEVDGKEWHWCSPETGCEAFEDNSGALEIARTHKFRPRTKHLNVKLHHFRSCVVNDAIKTTKVSTDNQRADCLTKPVNEDILVRHRKIVMGW